MAALFGGNQSARKGCISLNDRAELFLCKAISLLRKKRFGYIKVVTENVTENAHCHQNFCFFCRANTV